MSKIRVGFSIKGLYQYFHMIKPITNANTSGNIEFYILHLDKYYKYNEDSIEITDAITVNLVDDRNVVKRIKDLGLDFMIIFNPGQIFDVFITAICKESNTKTIYYQHGLSLPFGSFDITEISQGKTLKDFIKSLRRYLYFYKTMIVSIFFINEKIKMAKLILKRSYQIFFMHGRLDYPKYGLKEFHCDIGLVFGGNDKEYLIANNGFKSQDVIIGGYPILGGPGQSNGLPENFILYISSGLLTSKVIPITIKEEREFYVSLAEKAKNTKNKLVIKLHPTEDLNLFKDYVKAYDNVMVFKDYNLSDLVESSNVVIGDYSTALFYPIKHKKSLILLQSEFLKEYPFDFSDYGVGEKVEMEELEGFLKNPPIVNQEAYINFLYRFIANEDDASSNEVLFQNILLKKH